MDRLRRHQVFADRGLPRAGEVLAVGGAVEVHTHDFLEVAVLLAGTVTHLGPAGPRTLRPGAVTAVRPGRWHGYADPHGAVIGNLYLGQELLHAELRWLLEVGDLSRFLLRGGLALEPWPRRPGRWSGAGSASSPRTRPPRDLRRLLAMGLSVAVLAELAGVRLDPGAGTPPFSAAVRQALLLLGRDPQRAWSMAALSAEVGLSVSHLHREFRGQLGFTPMAWLARTRAEAAASLLVQSDRPVSWVGEQVGWPDPNYFSRCFRRAHGMSPSAYRARNAAPP